MFPNELGNHFPLKIDLFVYMHLIFMATCFIKQFLVLGSVHGNISFNPYNEMTQVLSLFYTGRKITFMLNNVLRVT